MPQKAKPLEKPPTDDATHVIGAAITSASFVPVSPLINQKNMMGINAVI